MLRKILSAAGFFFIYLIVILLATFYQKPIFLFLLMLLLLLPPASYLAARYAVRHLQPEIDSANELPSCSDTAVMRSRFLSF